MDQANEKSETASKEHTSAGLQVIYHARSRSRCQEEERINIEVRIPEVRLGWFRGLAHSIAKRGAMRSAVGSIYSIDSNSATFLEDFNIYEL